MRFPANENFPIASVGVLRRAGHDVASVIEQSPGAKDQEVLAWASREQRIILTFDRDYGELIYRLRLPVPGGVVYLRFDPHTPKEPADYVLKRLCIETLSLEGKFTVARRTQIRQRPLPKRGE